MSPLAEKLPPPGSLTHHQKRARASPLMGRPNKKPQATRPVGGHRAVYRAAENGIRVQGEAVKLGVTPSEWENVCELWAGTDSRNKEDIVHGYTNITRGDFATLMDGGELTDPVLNEIGLRIHSAHRHVAVLGSDFLYKMAAGSRASVRPAYWINRFGRDAVLGSEVKFVVAAQHVPGHWCLGIADLEAGMLVYYDPLDPAGSDQRARALRALRDYVNQVDSEQLQREDVLNGANHARRAPTAAGSFNRSHQIKPRQPDGVSCGICILAMVELIGEGRFNEEPKDEFSSHEISCYRARWACLLLHSPELNGDHGVALARRRAQNSESEIDVT